MTDSSHYRRKVKGRAEAVQLPKLRAQRLYALGVLVLLVLQLVALKHGLRSHRLHNEAIGD